VDNLNRSLVKTCSIASSSSEANSLTSTSSSVNYDSNDNSITPASDNSTTLVTPSDHQGNDDAVPTVELHDDAYATSSLTTSSSSTTRSVGCDGGPAVLSYSQLETSKVGNVVVIALPTQTVRLVSVEDPWITQELHTKHRYSPVLYQGDAVLAANLYAFQQYEAYWVPRERRGYVAGGVAYCKARQRYFILMSLWRTKCIDRAIMFLLYDITKKTCTMEDRLSAINVHMVEHTYSQMNWSDACNCYLAYAQTYIADPGCETDFRKHYLNRQTAKDYRSGGTGANAQAPTGVETVPTPSKRKSARATAVTPPASRARARTAGKYEQLASFLCLHVTL
jgi:hypothetical protein